MILHSRFFFALANRRKDKKTITASHLMGFVRTGLTYIVRLTHAPRNVSY